MTQREMREKAVRYIEEIRALDVVIPDLPSEYEITWETLGNLCLILAGHRFLKVVSER